jgi:hypothetical protein
MKEPTREILLHQLNSRDSVEREVRTGFRNEIRTLRNIVHLRIAFTNTPRANVIREDRHKRKYSLNWQYFMKGALYKAESRELAITYSP